MIELQGYVVGPCIYENQRHHIYRGTRLADGQSVIIKLQSQSYPQLAELARFRNQYEMISQFTAPGIVRFLALERYEQRYALIMADSGGMSLRHFLREHPDGLAAHPNGVMQTLQIALQLANALWALYQHGIVHYDITASNIIIQPETLAVELIDFSLALQVGTAGEPLLPAPGGTLAYMPPEQSGRTQHVSDHRADFYGLGVTLYQLLLNQLPFPSTDPVRALHSHLAREPMSPSMVQPAIPEVVSQIILKLMAKDPDDRYQTPWGLRADIEQALHALETTGSLTPFRLAQRDLPDRLAFPTRLYGQQQQLYVELAHIQLQTRKLVLITGPFGAGKRSLLTSLVPHLLQEGTQFVEGTFTPLSAEQSANGLLQAIQRLLHQRMSSSPEALDTLRQTIATVIGRDVALLYWLLPELATILRDTSAVTLTPSLINHRRMESLLVSFVNLLATPDIPLVLLLEDLHHADTMGLRLLATFLSQITVPVLVLATADDIPNTRPVLAALRELCDSDVALVALPVDELSVPERIAFIGDTLHLSQTDRLILGQAIGGQVGGNPLHIIRALHSLLQQGAIWFDPFQIAWQFDLRAVYRLTTSDVVTDGIRLLLDQLDGITLHTLMSVGCLGYQVSLPLLASALGLEPAHVERLLHPLVAAGVLQPLPSDTAQPTEWHQFVHADIREHILSLLTTEQQQQLHAELGMALFRSPLAYTPSHRYVLIEQLYMGGYQHLSTHQRETLAELIRDVLAHTHQYGTAAMNLAQYGLELLATLGPAWYGLRTSLLHLALTTLLLEGDHERLQEMYEAAMSWVTDLPTRVAAGTISMQSHMAAGYHDRVLATGRQLLYLLDIPVPDRITDEEQQALVTHIGQQIEQVGIDRLADLPAMTDQQGLRQSEIIYLMLMSAHNTGTGMFAYLTLAHCLQSITRGNTPESGYTYTGYGMIWGAITGDYNTAYRLGLAGVQVGKLHAPPLLQAHIGIKFGFCMVHLVRPLRESLAYLHDAYEQAAQSQDSEGMARARSAEALILLHVGEHLSTIEQQIGLWSGTVRRLNQQHMQSLITMYHQVALNLLQMTDTPWQIVGEVHDEAAAEHMFIERHDMTSLCILLYHRLLLATLFNQTHQGTLTADRLKQVLGAVGGLPIEPLALSLLALHHLLALPTAQQPDEHQLLEIGMYQQQMERWAESSPTNYRHRVLLLAAERARIAGDLYAAMQLYEEASNMAHEHGWLCDEAMIYECAGRCFLSVGQQRVARTYLTHAYYGFDHWGAQAKVHQMETTYGRLLDTSLRRTHWNEPVEETTTSSSGTAMLDIATIVRASQAMTEQTQLDQLLPTLVEMMLEHAGANHAVLLLHRETDWMVAAIGTQHQQTVTLWPDTDAVHPVLFPQSVVRYVSRTRQMVNLTDARADTLFGHDPYIRQHRPKSIFCIPFIKQQELVAVLYLENTLITGAFTNSTRELLQILSGQAAIALQNAVLYDRLARSIVDLKHARDRLRHQAYHDSLTGLLNRDRFVDVLRDVIESPDKQQVAVLFLDVDRFRIINDSYGHTVGDRMLQEVARRIQKRIGEGIDIARLGADEFMLLAHQYGTEAQAVALAEDILELFAQPLTFDTYKIYTNVSIGITLSSMGYEHAEDLMRDADVALNRAKSRGRGTYALFDPSLQMALREAHELEHDLRQIVHSKEAPFAGLYLAYQPLIALNDNRLIGFEALLRWNHPARGNVPPGSFIRLAEETNMIVPIGWWSIHEACRQFDVWRLQDTDLTINVNISPMHLQQPDFAERLVALVDAYQVPRSALKLEITESCTLDSSFVTADLLKQLRRLGFRLCIDDFGTGYSSLSRLHELPIDTVKIDRSFLKRIQDEQEGMEIVQMITSLAHALGMDVVAEGIETQDQLELLRRTGCGYGQGFFLARPLDADAAEQFLLARQVSE